MKFLGITQRVDIIPSYGERRDCLDQRWWAFSRQLGFIPTPLFNVPAEQATEYLDSISLSAVLLSGGNSLSFLEPEALDVAPERDNFELTLIEYALQKEIPILGVCRGMQIITHYSDGKLEKVQSHIATRHKVVFSEKFKKEEARVVNSFHQWGIKKSNLGEELLPVAYSSDGTIEAVQHKSYRMMGIMWHPEREQPFNQLDIELIKRFYL